MLDPRSGNCIPRETVMRKTQRREKMKSGKSKTDKSSDPAPPPEPKRRRGHPQKKPAVVNYPTIRITNACQRV